MTDTTNFDTQEKVDVLIKSAFGFPSAEESRQWYEEVAVPYNNYVIGDEILLDEIPAIPDFDTNGTVKSATDIGLETTDFASYSDDSSDKSACSIVDDSTGVIRRIKLLILEQTPNLAVAGSSWYKLNSNDENIIKNAFQFNYNKYTDEQSNVNQPYLYKLNTQDETDPDLTLPMGKKGGNWFIDLKSGVLFFSDFDNFSNGTQTTAKYQVNVTTNKPVLTIYTYIGRIGASKMLTVGADEANVTSPENSQIFVNTTDNTIHRYDSAATEWVPIGGSGGSGGDVELPENWNQLGEAVIEDSVDSNMSAVCALSNDGSTIATMSNSNNNYTARYFFIQLETEDELLGYSEIEIYDEAGTNIALNKTTKMSSLHSNVYSSSNVNDGITDGTTNSAFSTAVSGQRSWLGMDLESNIEITSINVFGHIKTADATYLPGGVSHSRIAPFRIFLYEDADYTDSFTDGGTGPLNYLNYQLHSNDATTNGVINGNQQVFTFNNFRFLKLYRYSSADSIWSQIGSINGIAGQPIADKTVSLSNDGSTVALSSYNVSSTFTARYFFIQLETKNQMLVASEIEIYDENGDNIALNKTLAIQSSNYNVSDLAVQGNDGLTVGSYAWTSAVSGERSWWGVDLEENKNIASIKFYGHNSTLYIPGGSAYSRTAPFRIFLYEESVYTGSFADGTGPLNYDKYQLLSGDATDSSIINGNQQVFTFNSFPIGNVRVFQYDNSNNTWPQLGQTIHNEITHNSGITTSLTNYNDSTTVALSSYDTSSTYTARYFFIQLDTTNTSMNYSEIEIYDENGNNVALNQPAIKSSIYYAGDFPASNVVNGINNTPLNADEDFMHTGSSSGVREWCGVDLGSNTQISEIRIYSGNYPYSHDTHYTRTAPFRIFLYEDADYTGSFTDSGTGPLDYHNFQLHTDDATTNEFINGNQQVFTFNSFHPIRGNARVFQYSNTVPTWTQLGQTIEGKVDNATNVSLSNDGNTVSIGSYAVPFTARYLFYQLETVKEYLQISEVEIYDETGTNIALNKPSIQSSYGNSTNPSSYANDSITDNLNNQIFTNAVTGQRSWWGIDLGVDRQISSIKVYGRPRGDFIEGAIYYSRIAPFRIFLYKDANYTVSFADGGTGPLDYDRYQLHTNDATTNETINGNQQVFTFNLSQVTTGNARVFTYDTTTTTWSQLGEDIDEETYGDQAATNVLSGDGTIVAIGAPYNDGVNGTESGHVRVYQRDSNKTVAVIDQTDVSFGPVGWNQLGQDINGYAAGDESGSSLSLSNDGFTVAIGAPKNDGNGTDSGHVRIYKYASATNLWTQKGLDIGGNSSGDQFGSSVALSGDGTILMSGIAKVYQYGHSLSEVLNIGDIMVGHIGGNTTTLLGKNALLNNHNATGNTAIGYRSGENNTIGSNNTFLGALTDINSTNPNCENSTAIGYGAQITGSNQVVLGTSDNVVNIPGSIQLFHSPSTDISQESRSYSDDFAYTEIGAFSPNDTRNSTISEDGKIVAVSSPNNNNGKVCVYKRNVSNDNNINTITWYQYGNTVYSPTHSGTANSFGDSINLSNNGNIMSVSDMGSRTVDVFKLNAVTNLWDQIGTTINHPELTDMTGTDDTTTNPKNAPESYATGFGKNISLSDDGTVIVVGAPYGWRNNFLIPSNYETNYDRTIGGHAYVFKLNTATNTWDQIDDIYSSYDSNDARFIGKGGYSEGYTKPGDNFGFSVSISKDGNTILVGAPTSRTIDGGYTSQGLAAIYNYNIGTGVYDLKFAYKHNDGANSDNAVKFDSLGYSVAISGDGKTAAIGIPNNDGTVINRDLNPGSVSILKLDESTNSWSIDSEDGYQQTETVFLGANSDDRNGRAVSISNDGTVVMCNALNNNIRIYTREPEWVLFNTLDDTSSEEKMVSMSGDGSTLVASDTYSFGTKVYSNVHYYNTPTSTTPSTPIRAGPKYWKFVNEFVENSVSQYFGASVSSSGDGSVVAVSNVGNDNEYVNIYIYKNNKYVLTATITYNPAYNNFGFNIKLSSDGKTIAVMSLNTKIVFIYKTINNWQSYNTSEIITHPTNNETSIISLSDDGNTLAFSSYEYGTDNIGYAGVMQFAQGSWHQLGDYFLGTVINENLGHSISLSGNGQVIAIKSKNGSTNETVNIYKRTPEKSDTDSNGPIGWTKINVDGRFSGEYFGEISLSKSGNIIAVGGSVYHYENNTNNWNILGNQIIDADNITTNNIKMSLSSDGSTVAIHNSGIVYIYQYINGSWNGFNLTTAGNDAGVEIKLSNDGSTLVIGDSYYDTSMLNVGHAYIYKYSAKSGSILELDNSFMLGYNSSNTIFGQEAFQHDHGGTYMNTAIGYRSLLRTGKYEGSNTGTYNTGVGARTLHNNTKGTDNTAVGHAALYNNTNGNDNVAVGSSALYNNTTGYGGVAMGYRALRQNTEGTYNVAIGDNAGYSNTTGNFNAFLGPLTDISPNTATWSESTAVGYNARITASNQVVLGTSNTTIHVPYRMGIGTTDTRQAPLCVNGSVDYVDPNTNNHDAWLNATYIPYSNQDLAIKPKVSNNWNSYGFDFSVWLSHDIKGRRLIMMSSSAWSDGRLKTNIEDVPDHLALQQVRDIPCKYYNYIDVATNGPHKTIGFIAQEVNEVFPMAITKTPTFIPDEYRFLENVSWEEILDPSNNITYTMSCDSMTDLSGEKYQFMCTNDLSNAHVTKEIIKNSDNTFTFDVSYQYVFCYGKEVNDGFTLDKDKIFALHHSAIQEIDRLQLEEKEKTTALETKVTELETKTTELETKNTALETKNAELQTQIDNIMTILNNNNLS